MPTNRIIMLLVLIAAALSGMWLSYRYSTPPPAAQPIAATILPASDNRPEFSLQDQRGNSVGKAIFEGQWDLVFFGFTHCPDVCPTTLQVLASARKQLQDAGNVPTPRIVLVSVDPERDTPEALDEYIDYFGDGNLGLTGDLEEIASLANAFGIYFEKVATGDGDYTVDHSAVVLVFDPQGRFTAVFSSPHTPGNYVNDLPLIMSGR